MAIDRLILRSVFTLPDSVTLLHLSFQPLPRMDKADTLRGARVAAGTTSRSFVVQPIEFSYRGVDGIVLLIAWGYASATATFIA